jgi:hypothetical protein
MWVNADAAPFAKLDDFQLHFMGLSIGADSLVGILFRPMTAGDFKLNSTLEGCRPTHRSHRLRKIEQRGGVLRRIIE